MRVPEAATAWTCVDTDADEAQCNDAEARRFGIHDMPPRLSSKKHKTPSGYAPVGAPDIALALIDPPDLIPSVRSHCCGLHPSPS